MAGLKYLESSIVYGNTLYILDWDVENIKMNRDDYPKLQKYMMIYKEKYNMI